MTPDLISQGGSHEPADPPRFYRYRRVLGSPGPGDGALRVRGRSLCGGRGLRATCSTQERHPNNRPFDHLLGAAHRGF